MANVNPVPADAENPQALTPAIGEGAAPKKTAGRQARSANRETFRRLVGQPKAMIGLTILVIYILVAIFAPLIAPGDPSRLEARQNQPPSAEHILGTTGQGQDVFRQLAWGARMSLAVGFMVGFLSTLIGLIVGMTAGYLPGLIDGVLNLFTNVFLIIPGLPLLITLASFLPPGPLTVILVLTFTGWAWPARVFRSQTLTLREKDFVSAAVVSGESRPYIIFSEILPNMLSLVVSSFFGAVTYAIGADAGLAFLGFENVNTVSWGTMLFWASNNSALLQGAWWTILPPGLSIALVAFATTMLIYAMDEVTNPRLRSEKEILRVLRRFHVVSKRSTPVVRKAAE
ncbi:MAG TPA: ABC transporter permease [Anaerolineaceae bacterium]|nr:ABC transporter permease [Anaerolineaceae bacterium]